MHKILNWFKYQRQVLPFRWYLLRLKYCKPPCNEFHPRLELNIELYEILNSEDQAWYDKILLGKRQEAHKKYCRDDDDDDVHLGI